MRRHFLVLLAVATWAGAVAAQTTAPAPAPVRLRGTIERADATSLTLKERSGETITLSLAPGFSVSEIVPIEIGAIQSGAFIGTAAMPQPDGTQRALAVLVFPESARGTGEGFRDWDLQPGSTMTNATVAELVASPNGRTLRLKYRDGEKTVLVPSGTPIVTFKPGDPSLLVPGAKVLVTAQQRDGGPVALRAQAGRNGVAPPM